MGQSISAIIFYGLDIDSPDESEIIDRLYEDVDGNPGTKINFGFHGTIDCSIYYIFWKSVHLEAYRGSDVQFDPSTHFQLPSDVNQKFQTFCKEYNIPYKEPAWKLVPCKG